MNDSYSGAIEFSPFDRLAGSIWLVFFNGEEF